MSLIRNYITTQKWRKVWGLFVQRAIGRKQKAERRTIQEVQKCVPLHSKIVNKPHQSLLVLSSRGTSRNVISSSYYWSSIDINLFHPIVSHEHCLNEMLLRQELSDLSPKDGIFFCCLIGLS